MYIKHYIIRTLAYKAGINKDALHMKQLHTRTRCTYIIKNNSTLCLYSIWRSAFYKCMWSRRVTHAIQNLITESPIYFRFWDNHAPLPVLGVLVGWNPRWAAFRRVVWLDGHIWYLHTTSTVNYRTTASKVSLLPYTSSPAFFSWGGGRWRRPVVPS